MCMNCPDFVDLCAEGDCFNPNKVKFGRYRMFHLDDKYCPHLAEKYGHEYALWEDRFKDDE